MIRNLDNGKYAWYIVNQKMCIAVSDSNQSNRSAETAGKGLAAKVVRCEDLQKNKILAIKITKNVRKYIEIETQLNSRLTSCC